MARVLGYGGVANTNGARDFFGKTEVIAGAGASTLTTGISIGIHSFLFFVGRTILEMVK